MNLKTFVITFVLDATREYDATYFELNGGDLLLFRQISENPNCYFLSACFSAGTWKSITEKQV